MKIKILSEEKIETLSTKENFEKLKEYIRNNDTNDWLKDLFREEDPFTISKIEMGNIEMDMSAADPEDTDFENARRLYEALKMIPESTACDIRLWEGLAFGQLYSYMKYRYDVDANANYYAKRWIFPGEGKKRDLFRQGISFMWWYAHLTYDDSLDDPYELTKFCFRHKDFFMSLYYRSFSNAKETRLAVIKALRDFELDGGNVEKKEVYNGVVKFLSFLGGAYLIDTFSREEIYEKAYDELIRLDEEVNNKKRNRFTLF